MTIQTSTQQETSSLISLISRALADGTVIRPADYAVALHTTLNRLHKHHACELSYEHLLHALGGPSFDHDAPINLLTILEHNGADDCLWALRATVEPCDQAARLMAADFAEVVLPVFEGQYPNDHRCRATIEAARLFALGEIDVAALATVRDAARDAAPASRAARDVARGLARTAAGEAATAARDAWEAARDARHAGATLDAQSQIIREYLLPDTGVSHD